jgi:hypothetical protein
MSFVFFNPDLYRPAALSDVYLTALTRDAVYAGCYRFVRLYVIITGPLGWRVFLGSCNSMYIGMLLTKFWIV